MLVLTHIFQSIERLVTNQRYFVGAVIVFILCLVGFRLLQDRLGAEMLDLFLRYDSIQLEERILQYDVGARTIYAWAAVTLDGIFPLAYGSIIVALWLWLVGHGSSLQKLGRRLAVLILIPIVFDWAENIQFSMILLQFPDITDSQVMTASMTTTIKWYSMRAVQGAVLALALVRLVLWGWRKLRKR